MSYSHYVVETIDDVLKHSMSFVENAQKQLDVAADQYHVMYHASKMPLQDLASAHPDEFLAAIDTFVHCKHELEQHKNVALYSHNDVATIIRLRLVKNNDIDFEENINLVRHILRKEGMTHMKFDETFPEPVEEAVDENDEKVKDIIEKMAQAHEDEDIIEVSRLNQELLKLMGDIKEEPEEEPVEDSATTEEPEEESKEESEEEPVEDSATEESKEEPEEEPKEKKIANLLCRINECSDDANESASLVSQLWNLMDE